MKEMFKEYFMVFDHIQGIIRVIGLKEDMKGDACLRRLKLKGMKGGSLNG